MAVNPQVIFVQGLAGIPRLIVTITPITVVPPIGLGFMVWPPREPASAGLRLAVEFHRELGPVGGIPSR
jgi:hypothetical protein